jgi:hypothetical protein
MIVQAWIRGLYPAWSFAGGKTPEVIAALRQLLSPDKPGFFVKQKMRPNEVLKKPLASVNPFWVEALYLLILCKQKHCIWYEIAHNLSGFVVFEYYEDVPKLL